MDSQIIKLKLKAEDFKRHNNMLFASLLFIIVIVTATCSAVVISPFDFSYSKWFYPVLGLSVYGFLMFFRNKIVMFDSKVSTAANIIILSQPDFIPDNVFGSKNNPDTFIARVLFEYSSITFAIIFSPIVFIGLYLLSGFYQIFYLNSVPNTIDYIASWFWPFSCLLVYIVTIAYAVKVFERDYSGRDVTLQKFVKQAEDHVKDSGD